MKYFRLNYDCILWEMSYVNVTMLLATIPVYKSDKERQNEVDGEIKNSDELADFLSKSKF